MATAIAIPYITPFTASSSNIASSKKPAFGPTDGNVVASLSLEVIKDFGTGPKSPACGHADGNAQGESVFSPLARFGPPSGTRTGTRVTGLETLAKIVPSCGHADGARLERSDRPHPKLVCPDHT